MINGPLTLFTFGSAFFISYGLTLVVRDWAIQLGWLSLPGGRNVHDQPTPRVGGLAMYIAFSTVIITALLSDPVFGREFGQPFRGLMLASTLIVGVGLFDDLKGLKPSWKLCVQVLAAVLLFAYGLRVKTMTNLFTGTEINIPLAVSFVLTVFWVVGLINAMNLIDGLDGLAASITVVVCGSLFFVSLFLRNYANIFLLASLAGTALGFFVHNRHPAKIFMGDSGSMFIGLVLASTALMGSQHKSSMVTAMLIPFTALAIPISDTVLAIWRRLRGQRPIFRADKRHLHHRLLDMGLTQNQIVAVACMITLYLGMLGFLFVLIPNNYALILLALLALGLYMAIRLMGFVERKIKLVYRLQAKHDKRKMFEHG